MSGTISPSQKSTEITENNNLTIKMANKALTISCIPMEVMGEIASNLDRASMGNFRLSSKRFADAGKLPQYLQTMSAKHIYLTRENIQAYLDKLSFNLTFSKSIKDLTVVGEIVRTHGPKSDFIHSYLSDEYARRRQTLRPQWVTREFYDNIATLHEVARIRSDRFVYNGGVVEMLLKVFTAVPNLKVIFLRKLKSGEHIPGIFEPRMVEELASSPNSAMTNVIFYGGYLYDTVNHCIGKPQDLYGDCDNGGNRGPLAAFPNDLASAVLASGIRAEIVVDAKWLAMTQKLIAEAMAQELSRRSAGGS